MRKGGPILRGELIGLFSQHGARGGGPVERREPQGTERQATAFARWKRLMDVVDR